MVRMRGGGVGGSRNKRRRVRRDPLEKIPDVYIYFLIDNDWYSIKATDCHKYETYNSTKIRLEPAIPRLPECIHDAAFAADGSIIYASGGLDRSDQVLRNENDFSFYFPPVSNKVFYIDTMHPQRGWTAAPPMNITRYQHKMLADAGKLIVFSGLKLDPPDSADGKHIFAEVYDPLNSSAGWKELARVSDDDEIELPQIIYGHGVVEKRVGPEVFRKIIFHGYNHSGLYFLGTDSQHFGFHDPDFGKYYPASTFLDGVLYFLDHDRMHAYDAYTCSGENQPVILRDVKTKTLPYREEWGESLPIAKLQALGDGHLALVWVSEIPIGQFVDVHCSIIKIFREGDLFVGDVLICSTYSVKCGQLEDCMVVLDAERARITKRAEARRHELRSI